jgi:hypothetical protein
MYETLFNIIWFLCISLPSEQLAMFRLASSSVTYGEAVMQITGNDRNHFAGRRWLLRRYGIEIDLCRPLRALMHCLQFLSCLKG